MADHTGERPYLCGVCGARFAVLSHLKQHNRIHARGDLWPQRKGAVATGDSIRMKTLRLEKNAFSLDKKNTESRTDNERKERKEGHGKDVQSNMQVLHLSTNLMDPANQPISNNCLMNSSCPRTVFSSESIRGEKVQEMQFISDLGNDFHTTGVTSQSYLVATCTEECGTVVGTQGVISQGSVTVSNAQCFISADSVITSKSFIKTPDVISLDTNNPYQCDITQSSVVSYSQIQSTHKSPTTCIRDTGSLCDRLNSNIRPVMPGVQDISLSNNLKCTQIKDNLAVATQKTQFITSGFSEGTSNDSVVSSGIHNAIISCTILPVRTSYCNVDNLTSSNKHNSTMSGSSLAFQAMEYRRNNLTLTAPINVDSITSSAENAVLTNNVDTMDNVPASGTNLMFNNVSPASFLRSNIQIRPSATSGVSSDQPVNFIRSDLTSPFSISFPNLTTNVLTHMPPESTAEKSSNNVYSGQQGE